MWLTLLMQVTCLAVKHLCPVLYCSCFLLLIFVSVGATHIKTKLATFAAIQASSSPSHRPPPLPPSLLPHFCNALPNLCSNSGSLHLHSSKIIVLFDSSKDTHEP